jgi:hypothetical protein
MLILKVENEQQILDVNVDYCLHTFKGPMDIEDSLYLEIIQSKFMGCIFILMNK